MFTTGHFEALLSCQNERRLKLRPVQFLSPTQVANFALQVSESYLLVGVAVQLDCRLFELHHTTITVE